MNPLAPTIPAPKDARTWPPMSRESEAGKVWTERMLSTVRACACDGARFMAGFTRE